jgi:hypothetical protein
MIDLNIEHYWIMGMIVVNWLISLFIFVKVYSRSKEEKKNEQRR